jgi:hypothetical protein
MRLVRTIIVKAIRLSFLDANHKGITVPTYLGEFSSGP